MTTPQQRNAQETAAFQKGRAASLAEAVRERYATQATERDAARSAEQAAMRPAYSAELAELEQRFTDAGGTAGLPAGEREAARSRAAWLRAQGATTGPLTAA